MSGVGDVQSVTPHGLWSICLPLRNGCNIVITGVCMEKVTAEFPNYELRDVEREVRQQCHNVGGETLLQKIPKLASYVGGETDILLGSKYLRVHPREVWRCEESGISVSDSFFCSVDGTTGVINGPHPRFSEIERQHWLRQGHTGVSMETLSYYTKSVVEYRAAYELSTNTIVSGDKCDSGDLCGIKQKLVLEGGQNFVSKRPPKCIKSFDEIDTAGTDVSFRCPECRNCRTCKKGQRIDAISIQEEIEQDLIERNVTVDIVEGKSSASLPFVTNPDPRIDTDSQKNLALKIYESQVRGLNNKPEEKAAAILSESKLHDLGFVDFLDNLPQKIQDHIWSNVC